MSDKRAALQTIIGKLAKFIPLLASDKPGEVLNAVQAMGNLLASAELDLHDLVTLISGEEKPIVELLRSLLKKDNDVLLRLGRAGASLFHSQQGETFADVIVRKHRVTWQLTKSRIRGVAIAPVLPRAKAGSNGFGDAECHSLVERAGEVRG